MAAASWTGELPNADEDYFIAPKVNYKFDQLRKATQQVPLNVDSERCYADDLSGVACAQVRRSQNYVGRLVGGQLREPFAERHRLFFAECGEWDVDVADGEIDGEVAGCKRCFACDVAG